MRIVKQQACAVLRQEMGQLETQCQRCQAQIDKFSSLSLCGLSGSSVAAAQERMRMQASVATSHLVLFRSLAQADRHNLALVSALPTTSAGVLDTREAQQRIARAKDAIATLQAQLDESLSRARAANELAASSGVDGGSVSYIDLIGIESVYHALIQAQRDIIARNERILLRARQYEREAASAYRAVETSYVTGATNSARSYVGGHGWGSTTWIGGLDLHIASRVENDPLHHAPEPSIASKFLSGDLSTTSSVRSGSVSAAPMGMGLPGFISAQGALFSITAFAKPYGKEKRSDQKDKDDASFGVEVGVKGSVAEGKLSHDCGLLHTTLAGTALGVGATGSLGASLIDDGVRSPSAEAKLKGTASALSGEAGTRLGTDDFAIHSTSKGELGTASAEAGVHVGGDGFEVALGSEAYVAKGEVATGITVFGVSVSLSKEASVGGKGVAAAGSINTKGMEGRLSAGLGLGAGVRVKVDWSGLPKSLKRMGMGAPMRSWQALGGLA